jgi:hypothetical protein
MLGLRTPSLLAALTAGLMLTTPATARHSSNGTHVSTTTISQDANWTPAGSPYILDGNVTVAAGATLTLSPGVVIKFNGQSRYLWVNGTLNATGTASQPIVFTSAKDDSAGGRHERRWWRHHTREG